MPEMTSYVHGTPSWVDLSTTDIDGALAFYTGLLGWEAGERGGPEIGGYTMVRVRGLDVAAISAQRPEQAEQGIPPHWTTYVSVDDADATAGAAQAAGGQVLAPAFDVMEFGRMAMLMDPTGAAFALWQAGTNIGARLVNDPGSLVWNELMTRDPETAARFYKDVFGWEAEQQAGPMPYHEFRRPDGGLVGGMLPMAGDQFPPEMPANWNVYFAVEDAHAAVAKATELGGGVNMGATEVSAGTFAALHDPQGAAFSVIKMNELES